MKIIHNKDETLTIKTLEGKDFNIKLTKKCIALFKELDKCKTDEEIKTKIKEALK